jgi:hypothetical protein
MDSRKEKPIHSPLQYSVELTSFTFDIGLCCLHRLVVGPDRLSACVKVTDMFRTR